MKSKIKGWIKRYGPGEIFATLGAMLGAGSVFFFSGNRILSAYAGVMGENIGFYGFFFIREYVQNIKEHKRSGKKYGAKGAIKTTRNLFLEFGPAEITDSFVIRPFTMYIFPIIISNYTLGIFFGKIAADILFYTQAIIAYELRKKHLK